MRRLLIASLWAIGLAASAPAMAAPSEGEACSAAFSAADRYLKEGKLISARAQLTACMADSCPRAMRPMCAQDLAKLEERIPTVVFVAKGSRGEDLLDVRVSEGEATLVSALDGKTMALDPGPHRFRFQRNGSAPVEVTVLLREGDRTRAIEAKLESEPAPTKPPTAPTSRETPRPEAPVQTDGARPIPWTVFAAGALTVAAGASFGYFGARGLSQRSDLDQCKGTCDEKAVDRARTSFTIADISLAVGVVALALTTVLFVTRPTEKPRTVAVSF